MGYFDQEVFKVFTSLSISQNIFEYALILLMFNSENFTKIPYRYGGIINFKFSFS